MEENNKEEWDAKATAAAKNLIRSMPPSNPKVAELATNIYKRIIHLVSDHAEENIALGVSIDDVIEAQQLALATFLASYSTRFPKKQT